MRTSESGHWCAAAFRVTKQRELWLFSARFAGADCRSADENDLAGGPGFNDLFMRARRLGEWHFRAHDRAQRAVFQARQEPGVDVGFFDWRDGPQRESANRGAARHELTRIDGDLAATANDDHTAIIGQKL